MTAAEKMALTSSKSPRDLPEGIGDLYDGIVTSVLACAKKGMRGMALTVEVPDHLVDYGPHVVGDLRVGGFKVDIIAFEPVAAGITLTLFVTW